MTVIRLDPAARDWLLAREGAVTLRRSVRHGCCGGSAAVPVAEPGVPASTQDYAAREVNGIKVFLAAGLQREGELHIRLEGFLGMKRLFVEGAGLASAGE